MIKARGLTKHYGDKVALDGVSFSIQPGLVTGFLGPNGAGKSTSMRLMVGLDKPTSGTVTIGGKKLAEHAAPMHVVGALLDAKGVHPGRSARSHLRGLAATHGLGNKRVDEVLEMNLEDAFVEYTRGTRRRLPIFVEDRADVESAGV